jgi:signal transduction histidine kinase
MSLGPVKVLLVDDLKGNLLALEGLLRDERVEIFTAASGLAALEFMISHEFAVALIDVQMPGMSGFELAELMRGAKRTKTIPIIFVTAASTDERFAFKGYESGAVDFLYKPLDPHAVKSKVNIFVDIDLQKRELKSLLAELQRTQSDLEHAVRTRDEFMSIASHELKTPLTALTLQAQLRNRALVKSGVAGFSEERLLKMFSGDERQLKRINHLIDDMLDLSRISSGQLSMNFDRVELSELVRDLVERSSELFVREDCSVTIEASEILLGDWDHLRLEQVVMNLLTNAIRYGVGQPIKVSVRAEGGMACIAVHNEGIGIAKENHSRIFQRFERAVGNEISGLGLGLYIVRQIVEAHQGSIRVESELGLGATFIVALPMGERFETATGGLLTASDPTSISSSHLAAFPG